MLADYYTFEDPVSSSWEKVTKRMVDPITFSCTVNVVYVPRIEDCSYETSNIAIGQPRFGDKLHACLHSNSSIAPPASPRKRNSIPNGQAKESAAKSPSTPKKVVKPASGRSLSPKTPTTAKATSAPPLVVPEEKKALNVFEASPKPTSPPKSNLLPKGPPGTKDGANKGASLGAFFSMSYIQKVEELDNQSLSSRSMSSRSVTDRSKSERSRAEQSLKQRSHDRRAPNIASTSVGKPEMSAIDEAESAEFVVENNNKSKTNNSLGNFLNVEAKKAAPNDDDKGDDDIRSTFSASTIGSKSVSLLSTADRSKNEKKLRSTARAATTKMEEVGASTVSTKSATTKVASPMVPLKSSLKKGDKPSRSTSQQQQQKLRFDEGEPDTLEVPCLSDREWYEFWDDIWYSEEELGDMRYEAFLQEAGLDVDEYMDL